MAFEYVLMTHRKIYQLKIKIKLTYSMYRKSNICIGSKKKCNKLLSGNIFN